MAQLQTPSKDFAALYTTPSIESMLPPHLDEYQFEHFVEYVFQQAGFSVQFTANQHRGHGTLDLKLFCGPPSAPAFHAGVQVKQYELRNRVKLGEVVQLRGGLPHGSDAPGYLVTTSTFTADARAEAERTGERPICPLDGAHFLRYITYVHGTRPMITASRHQRPAGFPMAPIPPEVVFWADMIPHRPTSEVKILTVANHKGGVGKTTTALNLAFGLMGKGYQVLLIDMDAQANLTKALGYPHQRHAVPVHLGEFFTGEHTLAELVRSTQFLHVWLIPSDNALMHSDTGIAAGPEAELRFVHFLHDAQLRPPAAQDQRPFDWIILDTGPWMGYFTRAAIAAAHYVLVPISPSVFADCGIKPLMQTVETMQALTGVPIAVLASLITQWRDDRVTRDALAGAQHQLDVERVPLLQPPVPLDRANIERAHFETAKGGKKTLLDKSCAAAQAYARLVEEVLTHVGVHGS
jgi:chromosome partitioning protein